MSSSSKDITQLLDLLYISFKDIESATNNFSDENLLTQGTSFKVYKGQLLQLGHSIDVVARKCHQRSLVNNELVISENLNHKNIVSTFKFTLGSDEDIIINTYEGNESLDIHLSSPKILTWIQRLKICVGVARALCYLHNDAELDHNIIHGNIKSSKILLDQNWEPKLHGFAFAVKAKKNALGHISKYKGALEYMDPTYETTRGLTHKSDVFSFGVLLFEVLFGREATIQNNDNWYFARLARSHYEEGKLDDLINPDLRKQMNLQSLSIYAETAYCCLKEQRSQRPDMNQILSRLERVLELQHKFGHATAVKDTSTNHLKETSLDHLRFPLCDIELATNYFSETYCIGSGGYGKVYKAELEHFDVINSMGFERKYKGLWSKKHSTVAVKRIVSRLDGQGEQGLFAEIEMLTKCKHRNIVSLLGFCDERSELILVYDYVSNGSLEHYLENIDNMIQFSWAQRLQICLDIAYGLSYLHTSTKDKQCIIHRDIKSANILLDDNWVAKISDFGLSKLHILGEQRSTLVTNNIAGTEVYLDPEYASTGKLKAKSDIYSFGVVMSEIMCGKLAYDKSYSNTGLPSIARQCFNDGTLDKLIDPIKEADENIHMLIRGVNQVSLDTFSKIANKCLAKTQSERPTMEVVLKELNNALGIQRSNIQISLKAIKLGTQNFDDSNRIGDGRQWKLYAGEVTHANGCTSFIAKRWDKYSLRDDKFDKECRILRSFNHKSITCLIGHCDQMNEKIFVYENGGSIRLSQHLDNPSLTWMRRLKICIDVAEVLRHFDEVEAKEKNLIIHKSIKSRSILLDGDWNAKICIPEVLDFEIGDRNVYDSSGYRKGVNIYEYSDVYSLGVILIEMLCQKLACVEGSKDHSQSLRNFVERSQNYRFTGSLDEMIFEGIKEQIAPQSLITFLRIAYQCLKTRTNIFIAVGELKEALKFQEDYEIGKPKLPLDFDEIIPASKELLEKLYEMLSKGIFQDHKMHRYHHPIHFEPSGNYTKFRKLENDNRNINGEVLCSDKQNERERNEEKKIEDYLSTLERNYSAIVDQKKDFEYSLKEALTMFPENEKLNEWKQKMVELMGRENEECVGKRNEKLHVKCLIILYAILIILVGMKSVQLFIIPPEWEFKWSKG